MEAKSIIITVMAICMQINKNQRAKIFYIGANTWCKYFQRKNINELKEEHEDLFFLMENNKAMLKSNAFSKEQSIRF